MNVSPSPESMEGSVPQGPFRPIDFRTRMPALDGIRALAITMVFLEHFGGGSHGGLLLQTINHVRLHLWVGVDLFFVLSGFLITGILYDTRNDTHYFKRFFARRVMRTFPLYYAVFALIGVLTLFLHYNWRPLQLTFLVYLGNFFGNFDFSLYDFHSIQHPHWKIQIGHFWSLCVEEQFYLLWPFAVWSLRERKKIIAVAVAGSVLALLCRIALFALTSAEMGERWSVRALPFRFDALLAGAILAMVLRGPNADAWQRACRWICLTGTLAFCAVLAIPSPGPSYWTFTIGLSFSALASAGLIGMAVRQNTSSARIFSLRPLRAIGRYSYGFYLFHYLFAWAWIQLLIYLTQRYSLAVAGMITLPLNYLVTLLVAKFSYDFFESKFLRLKKYFQYDAEIESHRHVFR